MLFDAEAAVLYFFILSGYVLTRALIGIPKLTLSTYGNFVLKRVLRIYPAFIFAFLLTFLFVKIAGRPSDNWLSGYWIDIPQGFFESVKQLVLIKRWPNAPELRILPHDWTLSIEIAVSLLLPVLAFASRLHAFLTLLMIYLCVKFLGLDPFTFDFSLGIFLALKQDNFKALNHPAKIIMALVALMLICSDYFFPDFMKSADHVMIHHKSWGLFILLLLILSSDKIQNLLSAKPLVYLGKISYSFYLLHFGILLIMTEIFATINSIAFFIIYLASTILISVLSYSRIEKPFIETGHKLTGSKPKGNL